ncbi:MAG: type IX secretion system membrane protein PorP/SprF [Bacteroidetes bacterium]|nr:type IX secretion system membrane protein PorP/SprF [Bacteroidota bacterium]
MSKKITYIVLLFFAGFMSIKSYAQQDAQYSQFMFNRLSYNPAFAGSSEKICATLLYRNQWNQFGGGNVVSDLGSVGRGGSPTTFLGNIHAPIGKFGIGANFNNDQLGFSKIVTANVALSYKFNLSNGGVLATGVGVGFVQEGIDGSKLKAIDQGDPKIPQGNITSMGLDLNFGLYYTQPQISIFNNFYAGVSSSHLNAPKLLIQDNAGRGFTSQYVRHYYFITGADYDLNSAFTINPNIMVKTDGVKTTTDLNATLIWNQNIRGGLSYRTFNDLIILAGYEFPFGLNVGYSYDLTMGKILNYSTGTHEIMLRYCFGVKFTPKEPKIPIPRLTPRFL